VVTRDEIARTVAALPFDENDPRRQPDAVFCVDDATLRELTDAASALDADVDPVASAAGVVYGNPAKGTTVSTPFAKVLARSAFRERTTNRNLRTLRKIVG
jgi:uncharacterized protein (DUF1697 family)